MIEKPQCERQGCGLLWLHRAAGLCSEGPSVPGWPGFVTWPAFVTWPLLRAAERAADASRALKGVIPIQSRFTLF